MTTQQTNKKNQKQTNEIIQEILINTNKENIEQEQITKDNQMKEQEQNKECINFFCFFCDTTVSIIREGAK